MTTMMMMKSNNNNDNNNFKNKNNNNNYNNSNGVFFAPTMRPKALNHTNIMEHNIVYIEIESIINLTNS